MTSLSTRPEIEFGLFLYVWILLILLHSTENQIVRALSDGYPAHHPAAANLKD